MSRKRKVLPKHPKRVPDNPNDPYIKSHGILGQPSNNARIPKATQNCWDRGMRGRTYGVAGAIDPTTGKVVGGNKAHTYTVYTALGEVYVKSVDDRKTSRPKTTHKPATKVVVVKEVQRDIALHAKMGTNHTEH